MYLYYTVLYARASQKPILYCIGVHYTFSPTIFYLYSSFYFFAAPHSPRRSDPPK